MVCTGSRLHPCFNITIIVTITIFIVIIIIMIIITILLLLLSILLVYAPTAPPAQVYFRRIVVVAKSVRLGFVDAPITQASVATPIFNNRDMHVHLAFRGARSGAPGAEAKGYLQVA